MKRLLNFAFHAWMTRPMKSGRRACAPFVHKSRPGVEERSLFGFVFYRRNGDWGDSFPLPKTLREAWARA